MKKLVLKIKLESFNLEKIKKINYLINNNLIKNIKLFLKGILLKSNILKKTNISLYILTNILTKFYNNISINYLPIKKKNNLTLIRSPHIFRKSQEQFTQKVYTQIITITLIQKNWYNPVFNNLIIFFLIKQIKLFLIPGIEVKLNSFIK